MMPSNVGALLFIILSHQADTPTTCIKLLKCVEGQYNKAYILSMNNRKEVVAKLPNPNAGPAFYTTASEVATRQFVGICFPPKFLWLTHKGSRVPWNPSSSYLCLIGGRVKRRWC
ncbi:hypothetical protein BDV19DRAFT_366118 [Aspergillus venezuelensis]